MNGRSLTLGVSPAGQLMEQLRSDSANIRLGAVEALYQMIASGALALSAVDAFSLKGFVQQAIEKDGRCGAHGQALMDFAQKVLDSWLASVPELEM